MWKRLLELFGVRSTSAAPDKVRYDNVVIKNVVDGTTIEGHEAVAAYFEREEALAEAHGSAIYFQVYRVDLAASTLEAFQGPKLAEIRWEGSEVSSSDTPERVKDRLRPSLRELIRENEHVTLFLSGNPMQDQRLFYADHFIMLPVWVQVVLHDGPLDEVLACIVRLSESEPN